MNKALNLASQVSRLVNRAQKRILSAMVAGRVPDEPSITNRFLAAMEAEIDGQSIQGVVWTAKTLSSIGPNTEEKKYGADFMGVLDIDVTDFRVQKGFLAQAKRLAGSSLSQAEWDRMRDQCDKMLKLSPDSFVFIYQLDGFRVIPAISVLSYSKPNIESLYEKNLADFYANHVMSFIGDGRITAADGKTLAGLAQDVAAAGVPALLVGVKGEIIDKLP